MSLVERALPPPTPEQVDRAIDAATHYVVSQGVTSVQHMGEWKRSRVLRTGEEGRPPQGPGVRRGSAPLAGSELRDKIKEDGRGDEWLRIGGLKGFVDGSLGSHTAAMFAPYTDEPGDTGLFVNTWQDLYKWIIERDRRGPARHGARDRRPREQRHPGHL